MTNRSRAARTAWFTGLLVVATVGAGAAGVAAAPATTPPTDPAPTDTAAAPAPPDTAVAAPPAAPAAPAAPVLPAGVVLPPAPVLPSNVEAAAWAAQEIPAVGSKSGEKTKLVQQRLLDLGFWNSGADGKYGFATTQAVMAFQKYIGLPPPGKVDDQTAAYLQNFGDRAHGLSDTGDLIEVDKDKQLLFVVRGGKTVWTFNTSTATGETYHEEDKNSPGEFQDGVSITPNGLWKVNRERPEGWWEGDLGKIYRPKYFRGGVAVHGSNSIPNYPASHGCVRVSVPAMDMIWDMGLMPKGITVWVHEG
jgi:hypothetical protein